MKRIEPAPASYSLIIIIAYPTQCLQVTLANIILKLQKVLRLNLKFILIVFFLVIVDIMIKDRIIL